MKKTVIILVAFLIGMLSVSLSARPPIKYKRSHWKIFGNYEKVTVQLVTNGDYSHTVVNCTGRGEVQCKKYGDCIIAGSEDYTEAEIGFFENVVIPNIDDRVLNGQLNGSSTFQLTNPSTNGQVLQYLVSWTSVINGEIEITINPIQ